MVGDKYTLLRISGNCLKDLADAYSHDEYRIAAAKTAISGDGS